jgi:hypothetical protein
MPRTSIEILSPARTELARGRPRAALKELEAARAELLAAGDTEGLAEALELARGVKTLAPADTRSRERLLAALEQGIASLVPAIPAGRVPSPPTAAAGATGQFLSHAALSSEPILATAHAAIKRGEIGRALRSLEKARQNLSNRGDLHGLNELLEMAQRLPTVKARQEKARRELIDATQQNVRFLGRRDALRVGEEWSDPFAAATPKTTSKLPSLPPMSRREILIAAAIVALLAGGITTWALVKRAPQRVAHAIKCPTGEEGSPTWSPDGKKIAFAKNGSCGTQITIISAKGGPTRELSKGYGVLPDWSPDGRTILYRSRDGFSAITVRNGKTRLIRKDDGDMGASWSPDGERIAFVHGLAPNFNSGLIFNSTLYTMKPDGSGVRRLLGHECNPRTPAWSPKGGYLVFACDRGVYVMRPNGGARERVSSEDFSAWPVSVATAENPPSIAFGWVGVESVPVDGSRAPKILANESGWRDSTIDVAWSPGGKHIAFTVTGSASDDGLYVIDRDGSHRRLLASF